MSIKQPIYHEFDLNATSGNSRVISLTHTDDAHVDVIELCVKQNGTAVDLTGSTVIARMVLHSTTDVLLNDSVPCTINDAGNILIPFDNAAVQTRKGIVKIEVNITRTPDILTLQLPLWVKINGSILDDATVDPHSEGTIPELLKDAADALEEATEALEHAGDYDNLEHKPSINGHTLSDNKTSADLDLQGKLTAGTNITIESDGTISASGGVTSYNDLDNKPKINGVTVDGNMLAEALYLQESLRANDGTIEITEIQIGGHIKQIRAGYKTIKSYDFDSYSWTITPSEALRRTPLNTTVYVDRQFASAFPKTDDYFVFSGRFYYPPGNKTNISQIAINKSGEVFFRFGSVGSNGNYYNEWQTLNKEIVSGVVNQNGTITFTDSDGNTFTTTGSSVIGADGFSPVATVTPTASGATVTITDKNGTTTANISNGADGQDYVLTAQDKSDIAGIVLSELPIYNGGVQ